MEIRFTKNRIISIAFWVFAATSLICGLVFFAISQSKQNAPISTSNSHTATGLNDLGGAIKAPNNTYGAATTPEAENTEEVSLIESTTSTVRMHYDANSPNESIKFGIGSQVTSLVVQNGRKKPSVDSEKVRSISVGTTGEVLAGPLPSDGYWWYLIKYSDGTNAWSVQDYFAKAGSISTKPKVVTDTTSSTNNDDQTINEDTNNVNNDNATPPDDYEICTSFSYGPWGNCLADGTQHRSVNYGIPRGCTGGSPEADRSCDYSEPVTTCTDFTYSSWGDCQPDDTQTRNINSSSPSGCTGGSPETERSCDYEPPDVECTSFTYSSWGDCQSNNTQSRTVTGSSPSGCTGGSPETSRSCTYVPPNNGISAAEVANHNSTNDCWLIINDKVYDVTDYIPVHPGGERTIANACGKESTATFTGSSGGHRHSGGANSLLNNYYLDDLN